MHRAPAATACALRLAAARPLATTVPTRVTLEASDHIVGVPCETFARAAPFVDGLSRRPEATDVSSRLGGAVLARWWCGALRAGKRLGATERVGENFEVFKRATRVVRRTPDRTSVVLFWPFTAHATKSQWVLSHTPCEETTTQRVADFS